MGSNKGDVIHFDGWGGLGASAVLKAIATRLKSSASLLGEAATVMKAGLDKIIHVDCSLWQNTRAVQKAIAIDLNLPQHVIALFDQWDEKDDFDGVHWVARGPIQHVKEEILYNLRDRRFLVIFHNGSGRYIDLKDCGILVAGVLGKRVLWTSRGRFSLHSNDIREVHERKLAESNVSIYADLSSDSILNSVRHLLQVEAEEVAFYSGVLEPDMSTKLVMECILYKALRGDDYGINWGTNAANYWVCDGIIKDATNGDRSAWEIAEALHSAMHLEDWHQVWAVNIRDAFGLSSKEWRHTNRWISTTHQYVATVKVPPQATSFFVTEAGSLIDKSSSMILRGDMFGHSNRSRLRVLHLSQCTFSFSSPPFLGCSNLRFLLLDHCKDKDIDDQMAAHLDEEDEHQQSKMGHHNRTCFEELWVLDISYTEWYWLLSEEMMDQMVHLHELNVKGIKNATWISHLGPGHVARSNSCRPRNLGKLRVTCCEITNQASSFVEFPDLSTSSIKTIALDGCVELEKLAHNFLPLLLESFIFVSNVAAKIKIISFQGCTQLKSLLLRGLLESLVEMDMSHTAIKMLDLTAMQAPRLNKLILLGCEKLQAILWPREWKKPELYVLHIDTTDARWVGEDKSSKKEAASGDTSVGSSSRKVLHGDQAVVNFDFYISLRNARFIRSLLHDRLGNRVSVEISSTANISATYGFKEASREMHTGICGCKQPVPTVNLQKPIDNLYMDDINTHFEDILQVDDGDRDASDGGDAPSFIYMWPCPSNCLKPYSAHCYISVQDEMQTNLHQGTTTIIKEASGITLPDFVHDSALSLHLHDCLSITSIQGHASAAIDLSWRILWWCRIERCPNLEGTIFTAPRTRDNIFRSLETFWASQLLKVFYIWDWDTSLFQPSYNSFENLKFLHLDRCPRLVHVLPLCSSNSIGCRSLKTLEIVCCGALKDVFPLDSDSTIVFRRLKRIHLHELPKLQRICGRKMSTPQLETMKIRGCWSLRRLPSVGRHDRTPPIVDCEKEWWDGLEWEGMEANHHPSLYKPIHSHYYKKALRRTSLLR